MTKEEFLKIIEENPNLTAHGFGVDKGWDNDFDIERANVVNLYEEALACEEFLQKCIRTEKPQKDIGSTYHIKHLVEKYMDLECNRPIYIPEGAVHIAAIHLGFKMIPKEDTTSVYLNISKRTKIQDRWIGCF
jgi:hypothetical protein